MEFDRERFKTLVVYIAWKAGRRDGFGATKLNKVLWFAEASAFVLDGKPIVSATYIPGSICPFVMSLRNRGAFRLSMKET
jgi:hypothetical protein